MWASQGILPDDHGRRAELAWAEVKRERESKAEGRFIAMMSWKLRLYFVVTEHLIKRDTFPAITMKDSLNEVQKKVHPRIRPLIVTGATRTMWTMKSGITTSVTI